MDFPDFTVGGWQHIRPLELENRAGYSIRAEMGWCDGFHCWKYWARKPDGKSLGAYSDVSHAALWIDRDMRSIRHVG